MPTFITNAPFPPTTTQAVVGSGTLTDIYTARPAVFGAIGIAFTVYDSAGNGDLSTPLFTFQSPVPQLPPHVSDGVRGISVTFTKGLLIVQQTGSSITVAWQ